MWADHCATSDNILVCSHCNGKQQLGPHVNKELPRWWNITHNHFVGIQNYYGHTTSKNHCVRTTTLWRHTIFTYVCTVTENNCQCPMLIRSFPLIKHHTEPHCRHTKPLWGQNTQNLYVFTLSHCVTSTYIHTPMKNNNGFSLNYVSHRTTLWEYKTTTYTHHPKPLCNHIKPLCNVTQ